jgi:hypothetical protein
LLNFAKGSHMGSTTPQALSRQLLDRYGPTLGGRDLYSALGFKSYAAFHRSKQRGELGVNVFSLPGRRGLFALTIDVAAWLSTQAGAGKI